MRVCKRGCDISRILIGYVLSDVHFDWLVGNMSLCQENLFQSKSEKNQHFPSFVELSLRNILYIHTHNILYTHVFHGDVCDPQS